MEFIDQIQERLRALIPAGVVDVIRNPVSSAQDSLVLNRDYALEVAKLLRDDSHFRFDYASNVTGIDWPEKVVKEKKRVKEIIDGVEREIEHTTEVKTPGYLEVVYHLYSMELKHGPLAIRLRTEDRGEKVHLPSLTPVWRGAEFQEREVYDLYGVIFDGHPDLRRILMWEEFKDFPMRKDYKDPDDYEYEPTAHDEILERAKDHYQKDASDAG